MYLVAMGGAFSLITSLTLFDNVRTVGYWISRPASDLLRADILTIVVPMAAILIWVSLPSTMVRV
jgi:hypothetical protein